MPNTIFPKLNCSCGTEDYDLTDADLIKNVDALSCDMTHEISLYSTLTEELYHTLSIEQYKSLYPSVEDFSFSSIEGILETIREHKLEALGYATLRILAKCYNVVLHTLNFTGNLIINHGMSSVAAAKIWDSYLNLRARAITRDLMEGVQGEGFSFDFVQKASQVSLRSLDFCMQLETICTDTSTAVITSRMKAIAKDMSNIGIVPSLVKGKVDMSQFLDERRFGDMATLGYEASYMPNLTRYCKDLATGVLDVTKSKISPVHMKFDAFATRISEEMDHVNAAVDEGTLDKSSKEYRARMDRLMVYSSRLAYCTQVLEASCTIASMISKDLKNMFYQIQVALTKIN